MSPEEAATALREEIEAALDEIGAAAGLRVRSLEAPGDLGPDRSFRVTIESEDGWIVGDLPTGLGLAYLADEEAAVDEFKHWLRHLLGGTV